MSEGNSGSDPYSTPRGRRANPGTNPTFGKLLNHGQSLPDAGPRHAEHRDKA